MTTINRATWTDDDGSGTTGTILNNARLQGDIYDKVDSALATLDAKDTSQDGLITANGPHSILSAQHPDTTPAGLVAGDLLVATGAPPKLARLAKGTDGAALVLTSGIPAWTPTPIGQWVTYLLSGATLTAATGTFTIPSGQAGFAFAYATIGKIGFVNFALGACTTSAATAWVRVSLPAALMPLLANQNQLGTNYVAALAVNAINIATASGLTFFPNVAQTGTFPAGSGLYLNGTIFFALA
jgi:hypothetical protein